jgi:RNA polymerase sigma-70 factor (ECF subfamily)
LKETEEDVMKGDGIAHIIAGCKKNDPAAQKDLYDLYAWKAKKICGRYIKNTAEAEEAADDGLLKVFRGIQTYDENKSFGPWFKQVITRTMYDHLRIKNSRITTTTLRPDCPHYKNPNAISRSNYNDLLGLIEKLPPAYKSVFTLYHIDGYDHEEISIKLNITQATSRSNLMKARRKLLGWMNEHSENE